MTCLRPFVCLATALALSAGVASAQDLSRYRAYALEASVADVLATSGAQAMSVKTLHERPAKVQQLEWLVPYPSSRTEQADPVQGVVFSFVDDHLYQMLVSYDRHRTEGLVNADLVESLSTTYGTPLLADSRARIPAADARADSTVVARWDDASSGVILYRNTYGEDYQLVVTGKARATEARRAIATAVRLDRADAPRRESEQRKRDAVDEQAAKDKARAANKAAFKP